MPPNGGRTQVKTTSAPDWPITGFIMYHSMIFNPSQADIVGVISFNLARVFRLPPADQGIEVGSDMFCLAGPPDIPCRSSPRTFELGEQCRLILELTLNYVGSCAFAYGEFVEGTANARVIDLTEHP